MTPECLSEGKEGRLRKLESYVQIFEGLSYTREEFGLFDMALLVKKGI